MTTRHFFKTTLAAALALATGAAAHAAPATEGQLCQSLKASVDQRGTIIRNFNGRDLRFVKHGGFCNAYSRIAWAVVYARDGKCYLKTCERFTGRSSSL